MREPGKEAFLYPALSHWMRDCFFCLCWRIFMITTCGITPFVLRNAEETSLMVPCPDGVIALGVYTDTCKPPIVYFRDKSFEDNGKFYWKLPMHPFSACVFQQFTFLYAFPNKLEFRQFSAHCQNEQLVTGNGTHSPDQHMIAMFIEGVINEMHKAKSETRQLLRKPDACLQEKIDTLQGRLFWLYFLIAACTISIIALVLYVVVLCN